MRLVKMQLTNIILCIIFVTSVKSSPYVTSKYETNLMLKATGFRLPNSTAPRRYNIKLEPHIDNDWFTFDGTGSVLFEVFYPTDSIIIHVAESLEIDKTHTRLVHSDGKLERPASQRWNPTLEFFSIKFSQTLNIGNYTIEFSWSADGIDHSVYYRRGFFRRKFDNENGTHEYMVATHLEPRYARSVYPCWDEPAFKAEFDISIKHNPKYTALSNMPQKDRTSDEGGKVWTIFETSPPMSTYMTNFVVSRYGRLVNSHQNMTIWSQEESLEETRFLLHLSPQIVAAYENYTGIAYSLPKLDSIVIPYFTSSANEHWGLITYGHHVLVNPETASARELNSIATLAAHEISHQWFGNLVTHAWWSDLWLTEAFAVFMSYKTLDSISPTWHSKEVFATEIINHVSFRAEGLSGFSYPIKWMPEKPDELGRLFTPITYRKGAAVVYMLEHILSEEVFREGIRNYLTKHKFGSATTDDLFASLQEAYTESRAVPYLDLKEVMDPWLDQTGFPLLNVTRDYETGIITISQTDALNPDSNNRWMIPITYTTGIRQETNKTTPETRPTHWLRRGNESLELYDIDRDDFILLNVQNTGFYQVTYDWRNWVRLASFLNTESYHKIHVINRAQLFYDLDRFDFSEQAIDVTLHVMSYLSRERDYLPWMVAVDMIRDLNRRLENSYQHEMFRRFARDLMKDMVHKLGFQDGDGDDNLAKLLRPKLIPLACALGNEECKVVARQILLEKVRYNKTIPPEHKQWVYCTGLSVAEQTIWDSVIDEHYESPSDNPAFEYLGCTNNTGYLDKYLRIAFNRQQDDTEVTIRNVMDAFDALIAGPMENYNFALDFLIQGIDGIRRFMHQMRREDPFGHIIDMFTERIGTTDQLRKLSAFLTHQSRQGDMGDVIDHIERASAQVAHYERINENFGSALQKRLSHLKFSQGS